MWARESCTFLAHFYVVAKGLYKLGTVYMCDTDPPCRVHVHVHVDMFTII